MKITHCTTNQENLNLNEKRQSTDVNTNMTDVGIIRKDLKSAWKISLNKEIEDIKKN